MAAKLTEAPAQAQEHLNVALKMVRHSLTEARRSVMNLRSATLDKGDLAGALSETVRQMMANKAIQVQSETLGSPRSLPAKIENDLLRIGQEAITNSLKYARAESIRIELNYLPQSVRLRIRDNGQGFEVPPLSAVRGAHLGLLGMRERAKQMGAQFEVHSHPGQGTEVVVNVPA